MSCHHGLVSNHADTKGDVDAVLDLVHATLWKHYEKDPHEDFDSHVSSDSECGRVGPNDVFID